MRDVDTVVVVMNGSVFVIDAGMRLSLERESMTVLWRTSSE